MVDVVDYAIAELGVREDPPRSNMGEPMKRYALPGELPAKWCGRFVRTMFIRTGSPLPGNKWEIPSVRKLQEALEKAGAWIPAAAARAYAIDGIGTPSALPMRGDLVLLNDRGQSDVGVRGNHVGIVERFDLSTCMIHSIDGNWGDGVKRVGRALNSDHIHGFGRWPLPG